MPWIGETLRFVRNPASFYTQRREKHGPIFRTHLLGKPTIIVTSHEACTYVLTKGMDHLTWGEGWPATFRDLLGRSLFVQDGEEHRIKRRLVLNAFGGPAMASYLPRMEARVVEHLADWTSRRDFTWLPLMKQLTFEIASDLLLGTSAREDTARLSAAFTRLTSGFFSLPVRLPGTGFSRALAAREHLIDHVEDVVKKRMAAPANDALSQLVHGVDTEGHRLSLEELKNQALLLLFAGHDTTTSFLVSLVRALADHPDVLEKARAEQRALGIDGPLTSEQLDRMEYLTQVMYEVERLYPPIPGGFRGVVKPFEFAGYHFPVGWRVAYRVDSVHGDPEWFAAPERFDPERFGQHRAEHKKRRFALMGFGGGPRMCLGMSFAKQEIKIIASHLLRAYDWVADPRQKQGDSFLPVRAPVSGYRVRFLRRRSS